MPEPQKQQPADKKPEQKKPEPLKVHFSIDAAGAVKVQGKPDDLKRLGAYFELAIARLEGGMGGDGSVTIQAASGKGTVSLTVIAF